MMEISLTQNKVCLIDKLDWPIIQPYTWAAYYNGGHWYSCTKIHRRNVQMHRMILAAPPHLLVDHINGNGLDNRRSNLRLCTIAQNIANQQKRPHVKYKGITKKKNRFIAQITINRTHIYLGSFLTPEDAAFAYDIAALKYFGEFAHTNFKD